MTESPSHLLEQAALDIWRSGLPFGGQRRRLAERFAEFGLQSNYEVAEVAVDVALNNWRGSMSLGRRRSITRRIADAAEYPAPESHYALPDHAIKRLIRAAGEERLAWDALERIARDAIRRGLPVPARMRVVFLAAMRGRVRRPPAPPNDPDDNLERDEAIRFAIRLALESGAFRGATHNRATEIRDGLARSACELVEWRLPLMRVRTRVGYAGVVEIWEARNRALDG